MDSKKTSASQFFSLLLDPKANVRQVRGIEKSADREKVPAMRPWAGLEIAAQRTKPNGLGCTGCGGIGELGHRLYGSPVGPKP